MAGIGHMNEVTGAAIDTRGTATAPNVVVQITGADSQERTAELYAPPGIASSPTPGDSALSVPVGQGGRIVIAVHNYKIEVPVEPGELVVYSTDEAGEAVKASARFGTDGSITVDADGGSGEITVSGGNVTVNAETIKLGSDGSGKPLVTYEELKNALDLFQRSVDAAIAGAITGHAHSGVTTGGGTSGFGAGAAPATSIDISGSESSKVTTD